jgi:hypothetical protein
MASPFLFCLPEATLGMPAVRIKMTSCGEELPVGRDVSESCYQKNRRDRFVEGKAPPTS